jgi:hypothetical protein
MTDAGGWPLGVRPDPRASLSFASLSLRLQMKVVLNLLAPEQLDTSHYPESKSPLVSALGSGLFGRRINLPAQLRDRAHWNVTASP